jgi:hypothetical protein
MASSCRVSLTFDFYFYTGYNIYSGVIVENFKIKRHLNIEETIVGSETVDV